MGQSSKSGSCCRCCTPCVSITILVIVGIALIVTGGVLIPVFDNLIHDKVKEQTPIVNGSQAYSQWHHPTSPVVMNYYMFDILNADDIASGKIPEVKQRGPYAYREARYNLPLEWGKKGNSLTYLQNVGYHFDPSLSCVNCTEDDVITTPNVAIMALASAADNLKLNKAEMLALSLLVIDATGSKLFHKLTVRKILWGYPDPALTRFKKISHTLPFLHLPDVNPFLALQYNGTAGAEGTGNITIMTGKKNVDMVQKISMWRGQSHLPYWKTKYGNMINGSDGTHFKPFSQKTDIIYVFITEICRSLYLVYDHDVTVRGIKLYRFTTDPMLFANHTVNPNNIAFCVPECYEAGILPVAQCLPMNPPIMISSPHFYQGAPDLWKSFKGLKPNKEKHGTFLDLEPYTGLTMEAYKRLQINLYIKSVSGIRVLDGIKTMKFPIMYVEEHAKIGAADADKFKSQVYTSIMITEIVQYLLIALGGFFIVIAILVGVFKRPKSKESLLINASYEDVGPLLSADS